MKDELVELIKSRDEEGLVLLKKEYSGLLHYIVRGILRNEDDIEECISDIHVKVWSSIDKYSEEKSKFSTWLTVISRNTALNYSKRSNIKHLELSNEIADSNSVEKDIIKKEQKEELMRIIRNLSQEEQQIFYRKYYYLQKTGQIANELGTTERSIEGKLYRIRKKLQMKLGGDFR